MKQDLLCWGGRILYNKSDMVKLNSKKVENDFCIMYDQGAQILTTSKLMSVDSVNSAGSRNVEI